MHTIILKCHNLLQVFFSIVCLSFRFVKWVQFWGQFVQFDQLVLVWFRSKFATSFNGFIRWKCIYLGILEYELHFKCWDILFSAWMNTFNATDTYIMILCYCLYLCWQIWNKSIRTFSFWIPLFKLLTMFMLPYQNLESISVYMFYFSWYFSCKKTLLGILSKCHYIQRQQNAL